MSKITNKAEHVWLSCYRAALTGLMSRADAGNEHVGPAIAEVAAEVADVAFREARKRINLKDRTERPAPVAVPELPQVELELPEDAP